MDAQGELLIPRPIYLFKLPQTLIGKLVPRRRRSCGSASLLYLKSHPMYELFPEQVLPLIAVTYNLQYKIHQQPINKPISVAVPNDGSIE